LLTPTRILVIRLSSLGDVLLTTPVIRALRKKYPAAEIDFIVKEEYLAVIQGNPHINLVFPYKKNKDSIKLLKQVISDKKYSLIVDLQNNLRTLSLTFGLGTTVVRFKKNGLKKLLLVHFKINLLRDAKQIPLRYADCLQGITLDGEGLEFSLGNNSPVRNTNCIGVAPGSKHFTKRYPVDRLAEIAKLLLLKGYEIHLIGAADDREYCETLAQLAPGTINRCKGNDTKQIAKEIAECSLLLCNDSGLMHLASAVKTPVAVVFGSTVEEFGFTPYNNKHIIIQDNSLSCRPCSHTGRADCPKKHFKCMLNLSAEMVFNRVIAFKETL